MKNKYKIASIVAGALAVGAVISPTFALAAQPNEASTTQTKFGMSSHSDLFTKKDMVAKAKGINGTVVSINGSSIVITDKKNTTYTVDTSSSKFGGEGVGNALTLSNILVGDKISVRGAINGTNITASLISDMSYVSRTVFSGKVTAINGSTITLLKNKNVTYTVNADSATLTKGFGKNAKTILASDVVVGDRLTVIGSLSGTTVSATAIKDMGVQTMIPHMAGIKKTN